MTLTEFRDSLARDEPPAGISPAVKALWLDGKQQWAAAHGVAQEIESDLGARIHAYLHRKNGDERNATHWYRRAVRVPPTASLEDEWTALVTELLNTDG